MSFKDEYTSAAKSEPNKTEISNEAYSLAEAISDLVTELKRINTRFA